MVGSRLATSIACENPSNTTDNSTFSYLVAGCSSCLVQRIITTTTLLVISETWFMLLLLVLVVGDVL